MYPLSKLGRIFITFSFKFQIVDSFSCNPILFILGANLRHKKIFRLQMLFTDFVNDMQQTVPAILKVIEVIRHVDK